MARCWEFEGRLGCEHRADENVFVPFFKHWLSVGDTVQKNIFRVRLFFLSLRFPILGSGNSRTLYFESAANTRNFVSLAVL